MVVLVALAFVALLLARACPWRFVIGLSGFARPLVVGAVSLSRVDRQADLRGRGLLRAPRHSPLHPRRGPHGDGRHRGAAGAPGAGAGGLDPRRALHGGGGSRVHLLGYLGSTVADVSAIGSTMIPPMLRAGYRPEQAVAVVSAASAMGILVPPCILMIVIGSVANVSVAALFAAGFLPAVVLALAIMVYIWFDARRSGIEAREVAGLRAIWKAFLDAVIPLGLPVIIFGGILGGVVTPTEAAVLAVVYAFIVGVFVYREIKWKDLPGSSSPARWSRRRCASSSAPLRWWRGSSRWSRCPQMLLRLMLAVPGGNIVFLVLTALLFIILGAVLRVCRRWSSSSPPSCRWCSGSASTSFTTPPWWWPPPGSASSCPHRRRLLHRLRHRAGAGGPRHPRHDAVRLHDVRRPPHRDPSCPGSPSSFRACSSSASAILDSLRRCRDTRQREEDDHASRSSGISRDGRRRARGGRDDGPERARPRAAPEDQAGLAGRALVIDVQNCFTPGGSLAVKDGDAIIPLINKLAGGFDHVVLTQDWHTPGHVSFASSHAGKKPFEMVALQYGPAGPLARSLRAGHRRRQPAPRPQGPHAELVIRKGYRKDVDSYSAFMEADGRRPPGWPAISASEISPAAISWAWPPTSAWPGPRWTRARPASRPR